LQLHARCLVHNDNARGETKNVDWVERSPRRTHSDNFTFVRACSDRQLHAHTMFILFRVDDDRVVSVVR